MPYLLHQLLEGSARRHPDRDAVVCGDRSLRYEELHGLSDSLAHLLRGRGIERGDRVGIYLGKSVDSIAAIFGILKAGAVYVPLDPLAPAQRIASIIRDCGIKGLVSLPKRLAPLRQALAGASPVVLVVLVEEDGIEGAAPFPGAQVARWRDVAKFPSQSLPPERPIENDLAYILYTSGSTGVPKGVMISHRASLSFVDWAYDCFQIREIDRVSNHAPLHFDLSIFDIFVAIRAGATVVLVPEQLSAFPRDLADFIARERISIWYSVPSALTRLILYGDLTRHRFSDLRKILFAGEVFPVKYLARLMALLPEAEFYNLYGPTETNVCTFYRVKGISPETDRSIPIGEACANTEVFAVTDRGEPALGDEVGELYVRGPSLMAGYWGMPERTQEVLVPHPFQAKGPRDHVYRTGDLVRRREDGNFLFLGRRDNMIKSRGYRIELGEIESVLYSHPEVEEAAVIAVPDEEIGSVIKALVVRRRSSGLTDNSLKSFCSERLPKYMIPSSVDFHSSLPKTSTGKIDKPLLARERGGSRPSSR